MTALSREQKLERFQQLAQRPDIRTGRELLNQAGDRVRILVDHPAAHRDWSIVTADTVRGFWHLTSSVKITGSEADVPEFQQFDLCLPDNQFEVLE